MNCLGKNELYFTAAEVEVPCSGVSYKLPQFWKWTESGNLNAICCSRHAEIFMGREHRGYLRDQLIRAGFSTVPNL